MNFEELKNFTFELIDKLDHAKADNVEIEFEGVKILVSKNPGANALLQGGGTSLSIQQNAVVETAQELLPEDKTILSPMVGTFYAAPAPDAEPFVKVGDRICAGDVICIIEAMKLMNEITADKSGVVKEILVENASPIGFGQPILVLE
ncbi:MAG: acetyl-CoA carboxylase biotin carboxyl carrier protein [Eubacteriales bacterium]|jgi:acetyl-CoA carboxylase biotin carboxyl carrier protein|nr:acetyl-CoA carboxylase biotin carboxyl carrier protein [Eubacteriales bacterium]